MVNPSFPPAPSFIRRFVGCVCLVVVLMTGVPLSVLAFVNPVPMPTIVMEDLSRRTEQAKLLIREQLLQAGVMAVLSAAETFAGEMSYQAAVAVASGAKGQTPVFFTSDFGKYLENAAGDAASSFVSSLSSSSFFQKVGFDICQPPNPRFTLNLQLGLAYSLPDIGVMNAPLPPRPRCDFRQVISNYQNIYQTLSNQDVLGNLQQSFGVSGSDIGSASTIFKRFTQDVSKKQQDEALQRQEGRGFKAVSGKVDGQIKTPSALVGEATNEWMVKHKRDSLNKRAGGILSNAASVGGLNLLKMSLTIFSQTLISQTMKNLFETGVDALDSASKAWDLMMRRRARLAASNPDQYLSGSATDARNISTTFRSTAIPQTTDYEVLSEMVTCPSTRRATWNCTVDQPLLQAFQFGGEGGALTLREAMDKGYLHAGWQLLPTSSDKQNRDQNCYTYAYCSGNLQKLRLMRLLPAGLEFAADSEENIRRCDSSTGCVTLNEVVGAFNNCSADGRRDATHPWCHLVDPSWVLVSVPQRCSMSGFSEMLDLPEQGLRAEECQDIQTCVQRNDAGECTGGYGYCLAEKRVYRFKADECPARFAGCRVYATSAKTSVGYVRNTLDYAQCSADNAGCQWYATRRDPSGRDDAKWSGTSTDGVFTGGERMYFDKTLEPCASRDEGCTKLLDVPFGSSALNLLPNSDFETAPATPGDPIAGWSLGGTYPAGSLPRITPLVGIDDSNALTFGNTIIYRPSLPIGLTPGRSYTLSFYAKGPTSAVGSPGTSSLSAQVEQYAYTPTDPEAPGTSVLTPSASRSSGCAPTPGQILIDPFRYPTDGGSLGIQSDRWRRFECTFVAASTVVSGLPKFIARAPGVMIDNVQFEESEGATEFSSGVNSSLATTYMKIAPDELACKGDATDAPACSRFATVCRQTEAGCQGYTPLSGSASEIPAILSDYDTCPASCVGYDEYRKGPSAFDLVRDPNTLFDDAEDATSTAFIPATAQICSQDQVGCEEFTGLENGATADFSFLRLCERPSNRTLTYFTWEGSESTGFQLRTWSLIKDPSVPAEVESAAPKIVPRRDAGLLYKDPAYCNLEAWRSGIDPDCRQFYDAAGRVYFKYFSQTVLSSPACSSFRLNKTDRADCEKTGGTYSSAGCVYQAFVPESTTCHADAVGCRAFAGPRSGNVQQVLFATFRDALHGFSPGVRSSEALLVGDSSLRLQGTAPVETHVEIPALGNDLFRVTFWAKAPGSPSTALTLKTAPVGHLSNGTVAGVATLGSDWQRYSLGPFNGIMGATSTALQFVVAGPLAYLDEISVEKIQDVAYVIGDSWQTPLECNRSSGGVDEPRAMLGCQAYRPRQGATVYARQFSRLCREPAIGCKKFVDTRNTETSAAQEFRLEDQPSDRVTENGRIVSNVVIRPADRILYLIDDAAKHCQSQNASCRAFGKPHLTPDRQSLDVAQPFETVYYKDDVTKYPQALCKPSELYCDAFSYGAGTEYFKAPQNHSCEYRQNVSLPAGLLGRGGTRIEAEKADGWFQNGTNQPCYPENLTNGTEFGVSPVADANYRGWGATCPDEAAECTEFRDPSDKTDTLHPQGKPYFFLRNDKLDTASCNGNVDAARGCVLLRNMSERTLRYNSQATDLAYTSNKQNPVVPVDCNRNGDDPACVTAQRRTCVGTKILNIHFSRDEGITSADRREAAVLRSSMIVDWRGEKSCTRDSECNSSEFVATFMAPNARDGAGFAIVKDKEYNAYYDVTDGRCTLEDEQNDSNLIVKTQIDRDCAQWLGCKSAETVFDQAVGRYRDICTNLALCDKSSGVLGDTFCAHYTDRATTSSEPILAVGSFFDARTYSSRAVGIGGVDYSGYAIPNSFLPLDLVSLRVGADGISAVDPQAKFRFALDYRLAAAVKIPRSAARPNIPSPFAHSANEAVILATTALARGSNGISGWNATVPGWEGSPIADRYPSLSLCQHVGSGRIGFYRPEDLGVPSRPLFCYLAVRPTSEQFDFTKLATLFQVGNSFAKDAKNATKTLNQAFPSPECRLYPEAKAPFPYSIADWDLNVYPPRIKTRQTAFQFAEVCEFGENCVCSYKRATFSQSQLNTGAGTGIAKYYAVESDNVPTGICFGGPRDGQSCIPDSVVKIPKISASSTHDGTAAGQKETNAAEKAAALAGSAQTCGDADQEAECVPFSKVETLRGVFGQCLEYDTTRELNSQPGLNPCLTWNPTSVLYGDKDIYHNVPSAGYSPPPLTGQYYCLSQPRPTKQISLSSKNFSKTGQNYAGAMTKIDFDDDYVSEGRKVFYSSDIKSGNKTGAALDGVTPRYTQAAVDCEDVDQIQDGDSNAGAAIAGSAGTAGAVAAGAAILTPLGPAVIAAGAISAGIAAFSSIFNGGPDSTDPSGLRLISTMRGRDKSYVETFYKIDPLEFTKSMSPELTTVSDNDIKRAVNQAYIGNISVEPMLNSNGYGRLYCGYQPDWVDGLNTGDKDNDENLVNQERAWRESFYNVNQYQPVLARNSEQLLENSDHTPLHKPCVSNSTEDCAFKVWETSYRAEDQQQKFMGLSTDGASFSELNTNPYKRECESSHPYFLIRAVFESKVLSGQQPNGPWRFVGFWTSTCAGKAADERFIYMRVTVNTADVCRQLAEVRSRDSRQDAAFTDRVWKDNQTFKVPVLNIRNDARFAPFSSALSTNVAGEEPLFLNGAVSGFSPLKPPTFIMSGAKSFADAAPSPKDKWAYLSNLFARIYRVYRWYDETVSWNDFTCESGALAGKKCLPNTPAAVAAGIGPSGTCNVNGECQQLSDAEITRRATGVSLCNSYSGINSGLRCSGTTDEKCHSAALDPRNGDPLLLPCRVQPLWTKGSDGRWSSPLDINAEGNPVGPVSAQVASTHGAFKCAPGSVYSPTTAPAFNCTSPTVDAGGATISADGLSGSAECPAMVLGQCVKPTIGNNIPGRCIIRNIGVERVNIDAQSFNREYPACFGDYDCSFTDMNFWLHQTGENWITSARSNAHIRIDRSAPVPVTAVSKRMQANAETAHMVNETSWLTSVSPAIIDPVPMTFDGGSSFEYPREPIQHTGSGIYNMLLENSQPSERARFPGAMPGAAIGGRFNYDVKIGGCEPIENIQISNSVLNVGVGRCNGGTLDGNVCLNIHNPGFASPVPDIANVWRNPGGAYSCVVDVSSLENCALTDAACLARQAAIESRDRTCSKVSVTVDAALGTVMPTVRCRIDPLSNETTDKTVGLDRDNNSCTRNAGYVPQFDLCPHPEDEFCGLISYTRGNPTSLNPESPNVHLPTDVTSGFYTPNYLGFSGAGFTPSAFNYISYYTPTPPRVAALDARHCEGSGKCQVTALDAFTFNGQMAGQVGALGGQQKSTLRFYAWAAHNQMPLRQMVVDWGDGTRQDFSNVKIKNHKPLCNVTKECYDPVKRVHNGLTCETDNDCPAGSGTCKPLGSCQRRPNVTCADNADCRVGSDASPTDTCEIRPYFGNSPGACEAGYFEFSHLYNCDGPQSVKGVNCNEDRGLTKRCSRNPALACATDSNCSVGDTCLDGLAPPEGCWDSNSSACRFTPRVLVVDNWGWCTGECRTESVDGALQDSATSPILHKYGGCYSGTVAGEERLKVKKNTNVTDTLLTANECALKMPDNGDPLLKVNRPWVVYPGALYLRAAGGR